jgi:hypothetical protein
VLSVRGWTLAAGLYYLHIVRDLLSSIIIVLTPMYVIQYFSHICSSSVIIIISLTIRVIEEV